MPKTLRLINAKLVWLGQALGFTNGQRLRVDSSVTETDIHYPTDSRLLDDAARVISRLLRQARELLPPKRESDKAWFRDRHRQAHRLARQISQQAGKSAKNSGKTSVKLYAQLLGLVETLLEQVAHMQLRLAQVKAVAVVKLCDTFAYYLPLVQRGAGYFSREIHGVDT
jgi:IS5 family transposase